MSHDVEKSKKIILSSVILHNMCVCQNVPIPEEQNIPVIQNFSTVCDNDYNKKAEQIRQGLIENILKN